MAVRYSWRQSFQLKTIDPDLDKLLSGSGIYVVRRSDPVPRVAAEDPNGILYVGNSSTLRTRLTEFYRAKHSASWFLWIYPDVAGAILARSCQNQSDVLDHLGDLSVKVATPVDPSDLKDAERAVLFAYLLRFGEPPPLNSSLPERWEDHPSDEWVQWGNEGLN
jgi:hypothetical protein